MSRAALVILVALASDASRAGDVPFTDAVIAGASHEEGSMKWSDELVRTASYVCSNPGRDGATDCVLNVVRVRNESTQPIQCHLRIEHSRPDDDDRRVSENDVVVFPGREGQGAASYGPADLVAKRFSTTCVEVPAIMPPLPILAECRGKLSSPSPDDFYPPDSRRRQESGDVILEYGVAKDSIEMQHVTVATSSGYQELDSAALQLSKEMTTRDQCLDRRYRIKVRFQISAGKPPPS